MEQFVLLKELPTANIGTIFTKTIFMDKMFYAYTNKKGIKIFMDDIDLVENDKEWFKSKDK